MKNTGKFFLIIALLMMAASAYAAFPQITQVTYTPGPAIPGSTITLLIQLENKDSTVQKGVIVKVEDTYPFTVKTTEMNPNPKNIGNIDNYGKALTTFTIYVDPTAENKTYNLPITIMTEGDTTGKKTNYPIIISGKEPLVKVVTTSNEKLLPGEEKEITLTVQNVGTSPAYDVVIEMQEDRTVTATGTVVERDITPLGAATAYLASVNPGEQKTATLKVSVSNTATIKNYTLPVEISYRNAAGTRTTDTSYIGLKVFANAELDGELKDITGIAAAGQKTDITIEIFNKGLGKAEFTLAEISVEDGTVEKGKQFIGTLGPNDVDTIKSTITFNKQGNQTINVKIEYVDSDATTKTTTIKIPIQVQTTTVDGSGTIILVIAIVVIVILIWNFFFRGKKKK